MLKITNRDNVHSRTDSFERYDLRPGSNLKQNYHLKLKVYKENLKFRDKLHGVKPTI